MTRTPQMTQMTQTPQMAQIAQMSLARFLRPRHSRRSLPVATDSHRPVLVLSARSLVSCLPAALQWPTPLLTRTDCETWATRPICPI